MKKISFLLVTSLFILSCSNTTKEGSQTGNENGELTSSLDEVVADTANAPTVSVENDTYDFGTIKEGEKVNHEYVFTNTGETPLIINSVSASCGCTTPNYPKQPVKPGEQGKVEVVFDSNNQPGMQHKVITMTSNANPSQTIFHLKGEVK